MPNESSPVEASRVVQHARMPSAILGRDVQYTIYLPPDYFISRRDYPVVYLLHGGEGDDAEWMNRGTVKQIMDKGIRENRVIPMIIASHDGRRNEENVPRTFYQNDADGKLRWGDVFLREFVPFAEAEYRVRPGHRAVGGLSMGGYGALMFSLLNPGMFRATLALSATVWTPEQFERQTDAEWRKFFSKAYGENLKGRDRLSDAYHRTNPLPLMRSLPEADLRKLNLYFECGSEDSRKLYVGNAAMHNVLMERGIGHEFTMRKGDHVWGFWREAIVGALEYASRVFTE